MLQISSFTYYNDVRKNEIREEQEVEKKPNAILFGNSDKWFLASQPRKVDSMLSVMMRGFYGDRNAITPPVFIIFIDDLCKIGCICLLHLDWSMLLIMKYSSVRHSKDKIQKNAVDAINEPETKTISS